MFKFWFSELLTTFAAQLCWNVLEHWKRCSTSLIDKKWSSNYPTKEFLQNLSKKCFGTKLSEIERNWNKLNVQSFISAFFSRKHDKKTKKNLENLKVVCFKSLFSFFVSIFKMHVAHHLIATYVVWMTARVWFPKNISFSGHKTSRNFEDFQEFQEVQGTFDLQQLLMTSRWLAVGGVWKEKQLKKVKDLNQFLIDFY